MAIKGLTTNREPSFPRIGILRKGGEKSANRPGVDLKHFRFDTEDAQAAADFVQAYGKEPTTINVYLAYPTPDENFQAWQEDYSAGGMVHRCDGETMTMWQGPDGKYHSEPKPCPYHTGEKKRTAKEPGCKAVGRLTVIIPELRRFAYVTVSTGSLNDIMELTDNLNAVYAMRGNLQGVPFILCRRPRFISTPKPDGGRARYEKWMLSLEVNPEWATMQLATMQKQAYLPTGVRMFTDGRTVDTQTGEIEYFTIEEGEPKVPLRFASLDEVEELPFDEESAASREFAEIPSVEPGQPSYTRQVEAGKVVSMNDLKAFHATGTDLYGKGWDDKRAELVKAITTSRTESSGELTPDEASRLIDMMKKRFRAKQIEARAKVYKGELNDGY